MILIVFISFSIKLFSILSKRYRICLVCYLKCTVSCIAVYMDVFLQVLKVSCIRDLLQFNFIFKQHQKHVISTAEYVAQEDITTVRVSCSTGRERSLL